MLGSIQSLNGYKLRWPPHYSNPSSTIRPKSFLRDGVAGAQVRIHIKNGLSHVDAIIWNQMKSHYEDFYWTSLRDYNKIHHSHHNTHALHSTHIYILCMHFKTLLNEGTSLIMGFKILCLIQELCLKIFIFDWLI